ncbi:MAG: PEP-CTERM sorting domain-containing protein [Planctomycetaceae bacterium]|jgi:hypothetical protein|nr:PEP-CTERM sorting domain-containing protein [Planctomycetaceae bacterium]
MKRMKKRLLLLAVSALSLIGHNIVLADFDAERYAATFNSRFSSGLDIVLRAQPQSFQRVQVIDVSYGGGQIRSILDGYSPTTSGFVDPSRLSYDVGRFKTELGDSGYYFGDDFYFSSFALNNAPLSEELRGKLNYSDGTTRLSNGTALTLGAAYLYARYALGQISSLPSYGNELQNLSEAITVLQSNDYDSSAWATNTYLLHLIGDNTGKSVWFSSYDPAGLNQWQNINWITPYLGEYSVFAMNLYDYQVGPNFSGYVPIEGDVLYLVRQVDNRVATPEPATILFWSFGGLTMLGVAWRRKRQSHQKMNI